MPSVFRQRFITVRRAAADRLATILALGAAFLVLAPLVAIFAYLVYKGAGAINWAFLTQPSKPVGEMAGFAAASARRTYRPTVSRSMPSRRAI